MGRGVYCSDTTFLLALCLLGPPPPPFSFILKGSGVTHFRDHGKRTWVPVLDRTGEGRGRLTRPGGVDKREALAFTRRLLYIMPAMPGSFWLVILNLSVIESLPQPHRLH